MLLITGMMLSLLTSATASQLKYYNLVGVVGRTERGLYNATITHCVSSLGISRTIYLPNTAEETFSFSIMPFPGENLLKFKNGDQTDEICIYGKRLPTHQLKARLEWSGDNQDYDLHINDINYSNMDNGNGALDHDWKRDGDEGEPIENITFKSAPADLYNVFVRYFADHKYSGEQAGNGAVKTKVSIVLDGRSIFNQTKTLHTVDSVWPINTLVIHSGEEVGGLGVQNDLLGSPGVIPYPMHKNEGGELGCAYDASSRYRVTSFYGPNGKNPVYLRVGEAAQFSAYGILNYKSSDAIANLKLHKVFCHSGAGKIDALGVFQATTTGKAVISHFVDRRDEDPEASSIPVYVVDPQGWMVADYTHDGDIDREDSQYAANGHALRMWMNTDSSNGDADCISEAQKNISQDDNCGDCCDDRVNGRSDLIDFFPIKLNLSSILTILPPEDFNYKLVHEDSAVNVVWTNLKSYQINNFYVNNLSSCAGANFDQCPYQATSVAITSSGINIPDSVLQCYASSRYGVIFIEGRKVTTKPLRLQICPKGEPTTIAYEYEFRLSISKAEKMFRKLNIRSNDADTILQKSCLDNPANYPDEETNGKHILFVHGYNVSEENALGWAENIFKKLYRAGSHAMFTAVIWKGDETRIITTDTTPNYYVNVINALDSSASIESVLPSLPGNKIFIAHSLGNMVVSNLLLQPGQNNTAIESYVLLNAAIPSEAVRTNEYIEDMIPSDWLELSKRTYSSEWYLLFDNNDKRHSLTWRGTFAPILEKNIPYFNFYSSTEDVLSHMPTNRIATLSDNPWVYQEQHKGTFIQYALPGRTACEGGWGRNRGKYDFYSTEELNNLSDSELITDPVFTPFDSPLHSLETITDIPTSDMRRLLADALPACSYALGSQRVAVKSFRNYDMNSVAKEFAELECVWPQTDDAGKSYWGHSAVRELAFFFVHQLFEDIVTSAVLSTY